MANDYDAYIKWFSDLEMKDTGQVGGKNASLGEMIKNLKKEGIRVPDGFATTSYGYQEFIRVNKLESTITGYLDQFHSDKLSLQETGQKIRQEFLKQTFPTAFAESIGKAYEELSEKYGKSEIDVAVRSSATAEDLPTASFAGQQETYLNIRGKDDLLKACRRCYASLFTDRAIAYREKHGFDHLEVALSVGVQIMVRADKAGAGVMFSIDTETGFPRVVLINAAWGLGETVVSGSVDPDEYLVFKPLLGKDGCRPIIEKHLGGKEKQVVYGSGDGGKPTRTLRTPDEKRLAFVLDDEEICRLARWAVLIEEHYERPMDIEWAKDGETGELLIVQARPETVKSRQRQASLTTHEVRGTGRRLVSGNAIGSASAAGEVRVLTEKISRQDFPEGAILVTTMTDPDWVPIMRKSAAIVTDHGGRTSHAAIVSRELGLPAIVGTGDATATLEDGQEVTVSCAEGDQGFVYEGIADIEVTETDVDEIPDTRTEVMLILAIPAAALRWWPLPADGIGLARIEFIINNAIKIHPLALTGWDDVEDGETRRRIEEITAGWDDKEEFFVDRLARGIARIAASRYPHPVIVRLSDFKTNEYAQLIGGETFEPREPNPMLGWRGASRYYSEEYAPGFALECRALDRVRGEIGMDNVVVMVPFCRTPEEGDRVLETMAEHGLARGRDGLSVYVMCEIPSNVVMAGEFAERFDGFSIGSNDLTQLVLGVDRDSDRLAHLFDERSPAVTRMIDALIREAHENGLPVGLCGQAPSDHPDFG